MSQVLIVAESGLMVVPITRKLVAKPISDKNSKIPILWWQERHLPARNSHENIGILSYHLSLVLQCKQTEREPSFCLAFLPNFCLMLSLLAWQHKKEPKHAPRIKRPTKNATFMIIILP